MEKIQRHSWTPQERPNNTDHATSEACNPLGAHKETLGDFKTIKGFSHISQY